MKKYVIAVATLFCISAHAGRPPRPPGPPVPPPGHPMPTVPRPMLVYSSATSPIGEIACEVWPDKVIINNADQPVLWTQEIPNSNAVYALLKKAQPGPYDQIYKSPGQEYLFGWLKVQSGLPGPGARTTYTEVDLRMISGGLRIINDTDEAPILIAFIQHNCLRGN